MASMTLKAMGDPVAFFRSGELVLETSGIYRSPQELKRSKSKKLRLITSYVVTVPYSPLIKQGDECHVHGEIKRVSNKPQRDGSGGLIVQLEDNTNNEATTSKFRR